MRTKLKEAEELKKLTLKDVVMGKLLEKVREAQRRLDLNGDYTTQSELISSQSDFGDSNYSINKSSRQSSTGTSGMLTPPGLGFEDIETKAEKELLKVDLQKTQDELERTRQMLEGRDMELKFQAKTI